MFCMQVDVLEHAIQAKRKKSILTEAQGRVRQLNDISVSIEHGDDTNSDSSEKDAAHEEFLHHRRQAQMEEVKNYVQILTALKLRPGLRKSNRPEDDPVFKILLSILRRLEFENAEEQKQRKEKRRNEREERRRRRIEKLKYGGAAENDILVVTDDLNHQRDVLRARFLKRKERMTREPTFSAEFRQEVSLTNGMSHLTETLRDVSMSDLEQPEKAGWLYDLSDHKQVWCVIADMLFCLFDSESSEKPNVVVLLPGCSIRSLVYRTMNSKVVSSNTVSGVDKYQIIIDDCSSRKKYLFSLESQIEQDEWMTLLKTASRLDEEAETPDIDTEGRRHSIPSVSPRCQGSYIAPSYAPSPKAGSGSRSLYAWNDNSDDIDKEEGSISGWTRNHQVRNSIGDIRRKLRRDNESDQSRHSPIKATHFEHSEPQEKKMAAYKKIRSFGSLESLFRPKRRNSKSDECSDTHSLDDNSKTNDKEIDQSSLAKSHKNRLSQSLDFGKSEKGLSKGLVRTASDLKDKLLKNTQEKSSSNKKRLRDLKDIRISGYLQYKHMIKWQKLWCVISKGCLYGFKAQNSDEAAELIVNLTRCEVNYVSDQDKRYKRLHVFKLTQSNKKSIYLNACDYSDLSQWLQILQMESSKIQCDLELNDKNISVTNTPRRSNGTVQTNADLTKRHSFPNGFYSGNDDTFSSSADDSEASVGIDKYRKGNPPQHDETLRQVWEKDKNYLFDVVRAKLSSYKHKHDITNRDLNGSKGDGLHIVAEGKTLAEIDKENTGSTGRDVRRSHSFQIKARTQMSDGECAESPASARKRHRPMAVKKISSDSLGECTICGCLERRLVNGEWIKYWYSLKDGTLFSFLTERDNVTVDIQDLHGYKVKTMVDHFRGKRFAIKLSHEEVASTYLSADSREEMETWVEHLQTATGCPPSEHSPAENGIDNQSDNYQEKCQTVKQKLLEEMLRQKRELELKQAARQKKQEPATATSSGYVQDDQLISDVIRLRQRRMSTQIKMDTIQKQIHTKPQGRKFLFGKKKKVDENKSEYFQEQLKELTEKMQAIDRDISRKEMLDLNQNRKPQNLIQSEDSGFYQSNGTSSSDNLDDWRREDENLKGNSLNFKNSVQKFAQKTKRSLKGKSKKPEDVPKLNGLISLNGGSNGAINIDQIRYDDDEDDTDLTELQDSRKSTNSLIDLTKSRTSTTSDDVFESKSDTSLSPRKEIDPSVMAEIDAFEELTRQVLNARSPPTS